jgi:hypothetical protein
MREVHDMSWRTYTPRIVKRVALECPHGRGRVEVDLLLDDAGKPTSAVRCTADGCIPPACDHVCKRCTSAVMDPASAIVVYPAVGPMEEID